MKRLFMLVLTLILLGCTAIAEDVQVPVFIDGVRVAFFDKEGNFLMQKKVDEFVYVPLQSFCESLGMNAEIQGQSVSVNNMRIGMFDADGNFLSPIHFDGIDYVPLLQFCEAISLNISEEEGKIFITRENTIQTIAGEKKESTGKIALHPYNFEDYFSYDIQEQNFKATQTRINMNGGFLYMNEAEVDYVLTCNARSTFEIENVSFSISGTVWEAHKTTSGISGVSFSEDMPANGSLTKNVHKSGSAFVGIGLKATEASLQDVSLNKASGCIIVDAEKAKVANLASFQKGEQFLDSANYDAAEAIFEALHQISYLRAEEKLEEISAIKEEQKEKADQEREKSYQNAIALQEAGDYEQALGLFDSLGFYKDNIIRAAACKEAIIDKTYQAALQYEEEREYQKAYDLFSEISEYLNSAEHLEQNRYYLQLEEISQKEEDGNPSDALNSLKDIGIHEGARVSSKDWGNGTITDIMSVVSWQNSGLTTEQIAMMPTGIVAVIQFDNNASPFYFKCPQWFIQYGIQIIPNDNISTAKPLNRAAEIALEYGISIGTAVYDIEYGNGVVVGIDGTYTYDGQENAYVDIEFDNGELQIFGIPTALYNGCSVK